MAIKTVRAQVNGTWHTLTYDSSSKSYKATITAPGATSYNQEGGYYNVIVEATNEAGTTGSANGTTLSGLRLKVKEKVPPVINIISPSSGAYVTNNKQTIVFTVTDEAGGSGVNASSLVVKVDGTAVEGAGRVPATNGFQFSYTPTTALADGDHTVTITCSDNDGNAAVAKSVTFKVDTVPPVLNISAPVAGLITNTAALTLRGTTNDSMSSPVTVKITLNGTDQGTVTVGNDGSFTKALTLAAGNNTIVVTATDAAGKSSTVSRTVTLDTSVPAIKSATITPNPVDAGATMVISVVVE